jgi:glycosyltransferase involved in cell wall biosynthesis
MPPGSGARGASHTSCRPSYARRRATDARATVSLPMRSWLAAPPSASPHADPRTPNLFVLGAPKAGTTFLHHALDLVPTVYMSTVKETGYFISERDQRRGLGYYLDAYFPRAEGHPIRGESTPWYLYSELALERIAALPAPEPPRFVVLVRRPSERARSMYLDQVRLNREDRSFEEAVDTELEMLAAGDLVPDVLQRYVWGGLYSHHVERWRNAFGDSRIHVIVMEDVAEDAERVWIELAGFLGHDLGPPCFDRVTESDRNPSGTLRWPRLDRFIRSFEGREQPLIEMAKRVLPPGLHRRVLQQVADINRTLGTELDAPPHESTLGALDEYYRPEVERLEALLGRPLTSWSGSRAGPGGEAAERAPQPAAVPPMRILHLLTRSHRRGAELVAMELADELDGLGHRNRLLALGLPLDGGEEPGLTPLVRSRRLGVPELVTHTWRLRRLLANESFDVVLAHGGWAAQVAVLAVPRDGPLLVWQHILGVHDKVWGPVRRRWWGRVAQRVDVGVALTDDLAAELRDLGFHGPAWVIPNSRKPDRFVELDRSVAAARLRAEVGVPVDAPLIGFVGYLVRQKRPERALEVLALLQAQGCPAHLVVAGSGPLRASLEGLADRLGVAGAVTFLGHRPDVEWVFGGVDLALLTSEAEGIPGVAIEALMAGCPMVTVPVGAVAEVVEHGVTGLVLDKHDAATMAAAVAWLLDDEGTRAAMSGEGRLRTDRFTASATAAVYAERLTSALAGR